MNYDPNMVIGGRMAHQTVVLTFQQWEFKYQMTVTVGGNCMGMSVLDTAIDVAFEELVKQAGGDPDRVKLDMKNSDGDVLELLDDDWEGEEWLARLLVVAEITSISHDAEGTKAFRGQE